MITRTLIYIKHNLRFIWDIIEWSNSIFFLVFYKRKLNQTLPMVLNEFQHATYSFRKLYSSDAEALFELIKSQDPSDLVYFNPHQFDINSIYKQFKKTSFLMMGVFCDKRMVGYFFLRFFGNKKCFVGRLIDYCYRGQGIGNLMNKIMYNIGWQMGFRVLSTISRNNMAVMRAHSKNSSLIVLKELKNDFMLVEFVKGV